MNKVKIVFLYLILIALIAFSVVVLRPKINLILQNYKEYKLKQEEVISVENTQKKQSVGVIPQEETLVKKEMFKAPTDIMGTDSGFNTLFEGILNKSKELDIKTQSVDYEFITPAKESSRNLVQNKFSVCNLTMNIITDYVTFEQFLQDIYSYNYLIKINSIEIIPYEKDKRMLLITLGLKLYVKN